MFSKLAQDSGDLDNLRGRLGLHPRGARDFLDALAGLGLLQRENGVYSNTPATDFYLDRAKQSYIGGVFEIMSTYLYPDWGRLTQALVTGKPQSNFLETLETAEGVQLMARAMTGLSSGSAAIIAEKFPWQRYWSFVDIGTAQGAFPVQIALRHPHLEGAGLDLPLLEPIFTEHVASFDLSDRLRFHARDFFQEPLPSAEVLVFGHVLHDWGLEKKRLLVSKAYEALPPGGAILVHDAMIDDDRRQPAGLLASLNMLVETDEGYDYTGAECREWLAEAGFRDITIEQVVPGESMVVGSKPT